uniref:Uncharacterized protein n=1 Tax=Musca domestica TaxID=7370 RepID=A0A1I8MPD2_MUSDO
MMVFNSIASAVLAVLVIAAAGMCGESLFLPVCSGDACPEGYVSTVINGMCGCSPSGQRRVHCPEGSVFENNQCRKIVCPDGEFYRGMCLRAMCPPGMVWRGKMCQEPEYLTTVLQIENVVTNEVRRRPAYLEVRTRNTTTQNGFNTSNFENVIKSEHFNSKDMAKDSPSSTKHSELTMPKNAFNNHSKKSIELPSGAGAMGNAAPTFVGCCTVYTPRICKIYGQKWICFNRKKDSCDTRICTAAIVYLKPPEIKYSHPTLIIPPSTASATTGADNNVAPDCSGCALNQPEKCSAYCSTYRCPPGVCEFKPLEEYCRHYSGQFGCTPKDGCLWDWC